MLKPEHPRDPDFQEALRALRARLLPGRRLRRPAAAVGPRHPASTGWVNLHFSVLPAWRGAAPVQHAIWAGDEVTGATTFRIVKELDAGPTFGLMTQTDPPGRHRRRPARAARRGWRRPARADPRRHRGRHARGTRAAGRRGQLRPEDHRRGRPRRLDRAGRRRRPADPRLHPGPRCVVDVRRRADQARTGAPRPDRQRLAPGSLAVAQERRASSAPPPIRCGSDGSGRTAARRWTPPTGPVALRLDPAEPAGARLMERATPGRRRRDLRRPARRPGSAPRGATCRPGWCRTAATRVAGSCCYRKPRTRPPSTRRPASPTTTCW